MNGKNQIVVRGGQVQDRDGDAAAACSRVCRRELRLLYTLARGALTAVDFIAYRRAR